MVAYFSSVEPRRVVSELQRATVRDSLGAVSAIEFEWILAGIVWSRYERLPDVFFELARSRRTESASRFQAGESVPDDLSLCVDAHAMYASLLLRSFTCAMRAA